MPSSIHDRFCDRHAPLVGPLPWQKMCWERILQASFLDSSTDLVLQQVGEAVYQEPEIESLPHVPGIILLPLVQAYPIYRSVLDKWAQSLCSTTEDPWACLVLAMARQSWFLYVPPGKTCSISLPKFPHIIVYVGGKSKLSLRYLSTVTAQDGWMGSRVDSIVEEEGAFFFDTEGASGPPAFFFLRSTLKKNSHFRGIVLPGAAEVYREDYHLCLQGEGAQGQLSGLLYNENQGVHQTQVLMEHKAPRTFSRQHFKAAVGGSYHHSFEGKIYIHSEAQEADAYQRHHALLLSPRATVRSHPNLEIFADDVKASHGATCGELDREDQFYLQSRGLSPASSRQLLIAAFFQDILIERQAAFPTTEE